ncbi:hypothetical protein [Mucisphaera sp.]|uniref:hypothetical protein n=1 Tax=Mucisphaera sp. TaxID=2913024 RepID=UPI003D117417
MNRSVLVVAVIWLVLGGISPVCAVDRVLTPVADGTIAYNGVGSNSTSSVMQTEYSEGTRYLYGARRILMKFDTRWSSGYFLRRAKLFVYGGSNSGSSPVHAYHYSEDGYTEASMPFPIDFRSRYLASTTVSPWAGPGYPGQWYAMDIGSSLGTFDADGYLSISLRNGNSAFGNSVSFVTRNSQTWNGTKGFEPFIVFGAYGDVVTLNPDFRDGLDSWVVSSGGGTASLVPNPYEPDDDQLLSMVAGSSVSVSQVVDTPAEVFYLLFDYEHRVAGGALDLTLTDRDGRTLVLDRLAPEGILKSGGLRRGVVCIDDPSWLGLDHVALDLTFDGETGAEVWLDNIRFADVVPAPSGGQAILLAGLLLAGWEGRRCRAKVMGLRS